MAKDANLNGGPNSSTIVKNKSGTSNINTNTTILENSINLTPKNDTSQVHKPAPQRISDQNMANPGERSHELRSFIGKTITLEPRKVHVVKTLALISNKGGVGKTHVSANTAFYLSRLGKKVLLIDLDLGNSDITNKLGYFCENTIADLLNGKRHLAHLVYSTPCGFDLIAGESGNLRLANLKYQQKLRFINALQEIGQDYDYVIYDLGAGIQTTTLDFALAQDHQVVLTTPQDIVAGYSCIKALFYRFKDIENKLFQKNSFYKIRKTFRPFIIINQALNFESGKDLFNKIVNVSKQNINRDKDYHLEMNLLGMVIGDMQRIRESELEHFLYSERYGASRTGQCFHFLAHNLTQYRDPNNLTFTSKLKRFATLFIKSLEETKYAH